MSFAEMNTEYTGTCKYCGDTFVKTSQTKSKITCGKDECTEARKRANKAAAAEREKARREQAKGAPTTLTHCAQDSAEMVRMRNRFLL